MFEWKRKELEVLQVKFFGGTIKKFISCYAKRAKPRIKIKLPDRFIINLNAGSAAQSAYIQRHALGIESNLAAAQGMACGFGGLGGAGIYTGLSGGFGGAGQWR